MKVFVSYSHADKKIVECLVKVLKVIGKEGIEVWYDKEIKLGNSIVDGIEKNIRSSNCFIPILSPNSLSDSKWCKTELNAALHIINNRQSQSSLTKIIPVYIKECSDNQISALLVDNCHIDLYREECESELQELVNEIPIEKPDLTSEEYKSALEDLIDAIAHNKSDSFYHIYNYQSASQSNPEPEDRPYLLRTLEPTDSVFFNKRGIFLDTRKEILHQIDNRKKNFITLQGESGSGKSSLVLAGIIPELSQRKNWKFGYFELDKNPYEEIAWMLVSITRDVKENKPQEINNEVIELSIKLKNDKNGFEVAFNNLLGKIGETSRILLIADQLESLYSKCSPEIRTDFLEKLKKCLEQKDFKQIVLLTTFDSTNIAIDEDVKSEEEKIYSDYKKFIFDSVTKITELNDTNLSDLITKPALQQEIEITDTLAKHLIDDLGTNRNDLMLLGALLDNLWDEIKKEKLTIVTKEHYQAYRKKEGSDALDVFANKFFNNLKSEAEKDVAKRLFLSMVYGIDLNNRIITKSKTVDYRKYGYVINKLHRIIKSIKREDKLEIEFAHKKIAENWSELQKWVRSEKKNLDVARNLESTVKLWKEKYKNFWYIPKDWSYLHTGQQLKDDKRFYESQGILLDDEEEIESFIKRSGLMFNIFRGAVYTVLLILLGTSGYAFYDFNKKRNQFENRFSFGEKKLLTYTDFDKTNGIKSYELGEFDKAIKSFVEALETDKNDPEALIYLNNAKASLWEVKCTDKSNVVATIVPADKNKKIAFEILRGVAHAQNTHIKQFYSLNENDLVPECNDHGVKKPLKIMIAKDENDKKTAIDIANHIVKKEKKVLAVIGHNASEVSSAAAIVYQKGKLVMITPTSFAMKFGKLDEKYPERENNNYIFSVTYTYEVLIQKIVEEMKAKLEGNEEPKVLICFDRTSFDQRAFAESFQKGFKDNKDIKFFGIDPKIEKQFCNFSKPNLELSTDLAELIKDNKINTIFLASHVNKIRDSFAVLRKISKTKDFEDINLFGSPTLYANETLKYTKGIESKLTIAVSWFPPDSNDGENFEFYNKAKKLWGELDVITWRTAMAFDTTNVIIEELKNAGDKPTRESLQKVLTDDIFKHDGATGSIEFYGPRKCLEDKVQNEEMGISCSPGKRRVTEPTNPVTLIEIEKAKPPESFEYYQFIKTLEKPENHE